MINICFNQKNNIEIKIAKKLQKKIDTRSFQILDLSKNENQGTSDFFQYQFPPVLQNLEKIFKILNNP